MFLKNTKTAKVGTYTVFYMVYLLNILHNLKLATLWAKVFLIKFEMETLFIIVNHILIDSVFVPSKKVFIMTLSPLR